jgi:hypothetical protein
MCTVIYIPTASGALFSSNRDENPARAKAVIPVLLQGYTGKVVYPSDEQAGGTWLGLHEAGHLIVLLNGAYEGHQQQAPYARSRGLIVKELLDSSHPLRDWNCIDLHHIEPFTIVLWQSSRLYELVWDGTLKHCTPKDASRPQIWSSSTLYDQKARRKRQAWFADWLALTPAPSTETLYQLLLQHNEAQNGFVMNRNELVKTLSISLIEAGNNKFTFRYHDLALQSLHLLTLPLYQPHDKPEAMVASMPY